MSQAMTQDGGEVPPGPLHTTLIHGFTERGDEADYVTRLWTNAQATRCNLCLKCTAKQAIMPCGRDDGIMTCSVIAYGRYDLASARTLRTA